MKYSILTGDIVNFTLLEISEREKLISETNGLILSWVNKPQYAEIFRGDSFQLLFDDILQALQKSIQLRCWFKKRSSVKNGILLDARISIGIGDIAYMGKTVLDSDGEAFHLSGRTFDNMKSNEESFRVTTSNEELNSQLNIITALMNITISQWTANQAEVIFLQLQGKTQQQMADELHIGQSAVNNRLKLAQWKEIDKAMRYIASLLN